MTEGQSITTGQMPVRIDCRESQLRLRELEARKNCVKADRARHGQERRPIDGQVRTRYQTLFSARVAAEATVASLELIRRGQLLARVFCGRHRSAIRSAFRRCSGDSSLARASRFAAAAL